MSAGGTDSRLPTVRVAKQQEDLLGAEMDFDIQILAVVFMPLVPTAPGENGIRVPCSTRVQPFGIPHSARGAIRRAID